MLVAVQEGVNSELWTGVFTMGLIPTLIWNTVLYNLSNFRQDVKEKHEYKANLGLPETAEDKLRSKDLNSSILGFPP